MDYNKLYKWLDFFSESYRITRNYQKFEELLVYFLTELFTPKIGLGPIFGSFFSKIGPGQFSGGLILSKPRYMQV